MSTTHIDPWARIVVTTLNKHLPEVVEPLFTDNTFFGMLRAKGRMVNNDSGKSIKWPVRYKKKDPVRGGDMTPVHPVRVNRDLEATLPWRNVQTAEAISDFEKLVNKGKEALIKIVTETNECMARDAMDFMKLEIYQDGNSTTVLNAIHGLESMFSYSGLVSSSRVGACNDTYAGIATALGTWGGTWTGTFPAGTGPAQYKFWTPLIVDYTNSGWSPETNTWIYTWQEAVDYLFTYQQTLQSVKPDVLLMDPAMFHDMKTSLVDKQRWEVTQNPTLVKMGVRGMNYGGVDIVSEYGVPSGAAYSIPFKHVQLRNLQDQIFKIEKGRDTLTGADQLVARFWGNLRFDSPAFFGKLVSIS